MRKPFFCICENKYADQLRGNREADQCLCFRYTDSTILLLPKTEITCHLLWLYSLVCVGPGRKYRKPVFSQRSSFSFQVTTIKSGLSHLLQSTDIPRNYGESYKHKEEAETQTQKQARSKREFLLR